MDVTKERLVNWIVLFVVQLLVAYLVYKFGNMVFEKPLMHSGLQWSLWMNFIAFWFLPLAFINAVSIAVIKRFGIRLLVTSVIFLIFFLSFFEILEHRPNRGLLVFVSIYLGLLSALFLDKIIEYFNDRKVKREAKS